MFGDLRNELASTFQILCHGEELRTITVAKPYCSPCRDIITATFARYGVRLYGYKETTRTVSPRAAVRSLKLSANMFDAGTRLDPLPTAQVAEITVSAKAAVWAEYLLLRTGKLYVPGQYQDKRNEQWAKQHGGAMPPAWAEGKPWIESGCKDGMKAWHPLRKAATGKRR